MFDMSHMTATNPNNEENLEKSYVTLNIHPVQAQQSPIQTSRSIKRRWNQLPRLQRVLIAMLIAVILLYLLSSAIQSEASTTPEEKSSLPKSLPSLEDPNFKQNLLDSYIAAPNNKKSHGLSVRGANIPDNVDNVNVAESHQVAGEINRPERQEAVVNAMLHAYKGYKTYAWGYDHLLPISKSRNNWLNLGLTMVDALDTLWIMNLKKEFKEVRDWVEQNLNFNINKDVNLFETTIRVLGGLLSSYHLTQDKMFLDKAVDLGDRLLGAFNSKSGVPFSDVNLATGLPSKPKWGPDSSTSEVTTIQLEFRDLSKITGDPKYAEKVDFVSEHIHKLKKLDGLVPIFINANSGQFRPQSTITLGARGDSYYEYLLKQWIQLGKTEDYLRDDFTEAVSGMEFHLGKRTHPNKLFFFGELRGGSNNFINKMDELSCYLPGTLALGVHNGMPAHHMQLAKDLLYTCVQTWLKQPTNLAAEITYFNVAPSGEGDFFVKNSDAHYLLRPETIESLFYMYRLTGNKTYQDWGWLMFQGIEKYCKVENGYTSIGNVKSIENTRPMDKMESFLLGETFKYLYLLFSDDHTTYSLDKYIFNTEAHLLPIQKPSST